MPALPREQTSAWLYYLSLEIGRSGHKGCNGATLWLLRAANDVAIRIGLIGRGRDMKVFLGGFQGIIEERIGDISSAEYPECEEEGF